MKEVFFFSLNLFAFSEREAPFIKRKGEERGCPV